MLEDKNHFKRITSDGSSITVLGAPDVETASAWGDLLSGGLDYAIASAKAEVTFKHMTPKVYELIERDAPDTLQTMQNIYEVVGDVFRREFTKKHLSVAKKEIVEKIDNDAKISLDKRAPLDEAQQEFVDRIVNAALTAYSTPKFQPPQ